MKVICVFHNGDVRSFDDLIISEDAKYQLFKMEADVNCLVIGDQHGFDPDEPHVGLTHASFEDLVSTITQQFVVTGDRIILGLHTILSTIRAFLKMYAPAQNRLKRVMSWEEFTEFATDEDNVSYLENVD